MQKKYIKVFRSKTKDYHTYICSEERLKYLRKIRTEIELAFFNFKTLNGEYATKSYTQFINNQLRLAQEALGLRLHTFFSNWTGPSLVARVHTSSKCPKTYWT